MKLRQLKTFVQALLLASVTLIVACESTPPVQEMSDARQAIAVAKEAGAAERAAFHLKAAEDYLDSAEQKLSDRQYSQARYDAKQAKMKAIDALNASAPETDNSKGDSE